MFRQPKRERYDLRYSNVFCSCIDRANRVGGAPGWGRQRSGGFHLVDDGGVLPIGAPAMLRFPTFLEGRPTTTASQISKAQQWRGVRGLVSTAEQKPATGAE